MVVFTVLGIGALVGIMVGRDWIETRIDMWQYPWGYAVGGRPALPGTWVGLVTTAGGLPNRDVAQPRF